MWLENLREAMSRCKYIEDDGPWVFSERVFFYEHSTSSLDG